MFDSKTAVFAQPWVHMTDDSALREFQDLLKREEKISRHAEDYSLFRLGSFDDSTGELTPETPKSLVTASALVATQS